MNGYVTQRDKAQSQVEVLEAENAGLRETLAWYADEKNYEEWVPGQAFVERIQEAVWPNDTEREWEPDGGDRARTFLGVGETPTQTNRDRLQAELDSLRQGIRSEVERLREITDPEGRLSHPTEVQAAYVADRLETLLGEGGES